MSLPRDTAYAAYSPAVADDTSVYGIWCAAWKACDEARHLLDRRELPKDPPLSLLPLLTEYSNVDHLSERDRDVILERLRTRWAAILAAIDAAINPVRECFSCGWKGPLTETCMLGAVGPLCPKCRETTEKS